jgi:hypothetical protein
MYRDGLEENLSVIWEVLREFVQSQQWTGMFGENLFVFPVA